MTECIILDERLRRSGCIVANVLAYMVRDNFDSES